LIANYHRNLAPLRQQLAEANVNLNAASIQPSQLPLNQKREAVNRAQAIYDRTVVTYERLAQYQAEGAISKERVEQAEKEMTVAKSDLNIAQSDYDSSIALVQVSNDKQVAQTRSIRLQQQLALKEQAGQIQQFQAQLQVAKSDYQQIGMRLRQLQNRKAAPVTTQLPISQKPTLEPTTIDITAPVVGTVIDIPISLGDRVFADHKLIGITNPKQLKIGIDLAPQQAALLKTGKRVIVKVGTALDSQELAGLITTIKPQTDTSTQQIEVTFTNPKSTTLIGQTGTVYFPR
jgi:hemolysin D